jgi:hypothetical protein
MPVIGRLDEQVHDVLIEPIGKRRTREESEPAHAPSNDSRRDVNDDEDAGGDSTRRSDGGKKSARAEDDHVRVRDDERLPVWLL